MSWTGADTPEIAAKILASMGNPTTSIVDGGEIVAIKTEHVWVEAFCDVGEYRGLGNVIKLRKFILRFIKKQGITKKYLAFLKNNLTNR